MALIWRFFVITFAFALASFAAAATFTLGALAWANLNPPLENFEVALLWMFTFLAGAGVAFFAFVPAMIAIVLAEGFSWRSVLFYTLAGGVIGLAYGLLIPETDPNFVLYGRMTQVIAGAGVAAGLVYWLIAGRNAGAWRKVPSREMVKP